MLFFHLYQDFYSVLENAMRSKVDDLVDFCRYYTVVVKIHLKFMFCFRTTIVLWCNHFMNTLALRPCYGSQMINFRTCACNEMCACQSISKPSVAHYKGILWFVRIKRAMIPLPIHLCLRYMACTTTGYKEL